MATSNFTTAGRDAFWDVALPDGAVARVATPGNHFIRKVQELLKAELTTWQTTYAINPPMDGSVASVIGTEVVVDGCLGPVTSRALYARARALGADPVLLDVIAREGAAKNLVAVAPPSAHVLTAAWLISRMNAPDLTPAQVRFPPDTVFPTWGVAPPANDVALDTFETVSVTIPRPVTPPVPADTSVVPPPPVTPTPVTLPVCPVPTTFASQAEIDAWRAAPHPGCVVPSFGPFPGPLGVAPPVVAPPVVVTMAPAAGSGMLPWVLFGTALVGAAYLAGRDASKTRTTRSPRTE